MEPTDDERIQTQQDNLNELNDTLTSNKTYTGDPGSVNQEPPSQPITMLAVPKSWTRLVVALCILLFMVVGLVSLMVYITHKTSRDNTDRIIELQRQLDDINTRITITDAQQK